MKQSNGLRGRVYGAGGPAKETLPMTKTTANLIKAFIANAAANRRYLAYGRKAQDDGFPDAARLFRAMARSETIQAANHLKTAGEIRSTADNVREALAGERECRRSHDEFVSQAEADHADSARIVFSWGARSEQAHVRLYEQALKALDCGSDCSFGSLHICSACGFVIEGDPPDTCPNCGVGRRLIPAIA